MSANPSPLSNDSAFVDVMKQSLDRIEAALKAAHFEPQAAGLSAAELRVAANVKPSAPCILEEDATLSFMGREIGVTLRAYGRWYKGTRGQFEPGGLQLTPAEPAGYSVDSVTLSGGANTLEVEIYNCLDDDALEDIGVACYEADPQ